MSVSYTLAAIEALVNLDDINVEEHRSDNGQNNGFHAFNIEIKALKTKGSGLGPVSKGRILGVAMEALQAAGYDNVEERNGYRGRDGKFVGWPHLRIIEPGTGRQASNAATAANTAQMAQLMNMVTALTAVVAQQNPAALAAITAASQTPETTPETPEQAAADLLDAEGNPVTTDSEGNVVDTEPSDEEADGTFEA